MRKTPITHHIRELSKLFVCGHITSKFSLLYFSLCVLVRIPIIKKATLSDGFLITHFSLFFTLCSLLSTLSSLLSPHFSLFFTHCSLLSPHYSLFFTLCSLLSPHCSLFYSLLPSAGSGSAYFSVFLCSLPLLNKATGNKVFTLLPVTSFFTTNSR
jgi:hypothetical protein